MAQSLRASVDRLRSVLRPYHPANWTDTVIKWRERGKAHARILSVDPPVVYSSWWRDHTPLHEGLKDRKLILLYNFFWFIREEDIEKIANSVKAALQQYKQHRIVLLCNEAWVAEAFLAQQVEALYCNHNCFVNETVFKPDASVPKIHDALYNAAMAPYKRHQLAAKVNSLALITYHYPRTQTPGYETETRQKLAHAHWLVDARSDREKVFGADLVRLYQQCRVGLCLSANEGAMFASIEYLLCGLPVVSTRNIGGRDSFFDPAYVTTVNDSEEEVAAAVKAFCENAPDPAWIHDQTVLKMNEHRDRLRAYLRAEVAEIPMPWPPGALGTLSFTSLKEVARRCRDGILEN